MNWALFSPALSLFLFTLNPLPESYWIIWSCSILCGVLTAFILTHISLHLLGTPCWPYFLDYFLTFFFSFGVNANLGYLHFLLISVQSLSRVHLFVTPWTAAHQASLCITNSRSLLSIGAKDSPLSPWCHPTISSSVIPFSSCLQSFPASGSFQMTQFFSSGGHSTGVSASPWIFRTDLL